MIFYMLKTLTYILVKISFGSRITRDIFVVVVVISYLKTER